jgi:hypothetical protein
VASPDHQCGVRKGPEKGQLERLDLLPAAVTIMLAAGDIDAAKQATTELAGIAAVYTTPGVQAELAAARGAVALSDGDPTMALPLLRNAARSWCIGTSATSSTHWASIPLRPQRPMPSSTASSMPGSSDQVTITPGAMDGHRPASDYVRCVCRRAPAGSLTSLTRTPS